MPTPNPSEIESLRAGIEECARLLQETRHLDPNAQKALSDLLRELGQSLHPEDSPELAAHLVSSSAELIKALHEQQDASLVSTARTRLEEATARAEAEAPVLTGVVRRLIDALAGIGV